MFLRRDKKGDFFCLENENQSKKPATNLQSCQVEFTHEIAMGTMWKKFPL